jgi:hypothetical protein
VSIFEKSTSISAAKSIFQNVYLKSFIIITES